MKKLIQPNWNNSNLNITATLAEFLHAPNQNATLPVLEEELKKNYKNVVFICFDGFGIYPIKKNLKRKDFLRKNIVQTLTSTFPSTTTNATTSLITNKLPMEHGWFGWSLHFEQVQKNIDVYLHRDSQTTEPIDYKYPLFDNSDCYFDHAKSEYNVVAVIPEYVQTQSEKICYKDEVELFNAIKEVCLRKEKQFIYAYCPEPDATMHEFGVTSIEAKNKINLINKEIEKLYNDLEDTLIIVTADHGHIDVKGYVEFYKDQELNDMLEYVPYLDARTPAFKIKKGKEEEFESKFNKKYVKDFKLFKTQYLIENNYFGDKGDYGYLLGDYIAVGTFTYKQFISYENMPRFKGHHTSLTEEMKVPLILLKRKRNNIWKL